MRSRPEAAKTKHIVSPVAGHADIMVVPDLEAGNMLAKQLEYLADATGAGIVLGARVPIILTSRADNTLAPHGLLRRRAAAGAPPARRASHDRRHPGAQCRLVEHQVRVCSHSRPPARVTRRFTTARSRVSATPDTLHGSHKDAAGKPVAETALGAKVTA